MRETSSNGIPIPVSLTPNRTPLFMDSAKRITCPARARELDRVVDQVNQHLFSAALGRRGYLANHRDIQCKVSIRRARIAVSSDHRLISISSSEKLEPGLVPLARLDPREIEQFLRHLS